MKGLKYIALSFILVLFAFTGFGCSASMSSSKVLINYNNMCNQYQNIFTEGKFNITYPEVIYNRITDTEVTNNKFLHLTQVYEPMLNYSMAFFYTSRNVLDDAKEKIDKKQASALNDKLMDLKNVLDEFITAKSNLEYHDEIFARDDVSFNTSVVLAENLKIYENCYTKLISKAFAFNNAFIDIYNSQYPVLNLREKQTNFNGAYFISIYNQSISKLLEIAFKIDGSELCFQGQNNVFFSYYTDKVLNEINNFNKLTANELNGAIFTSEDLVSVKAELQQLIATFQNNMDALQTLRTHFETELDKINYGDFIKVVDNNNFKLTTILKDKLTKETAIETAFNNFVNNSQLSLEAQNSFKVVYSYLEHTFDVTVDSLHDILNRYHTHYHGSANDINSYVIGQ